MIKKIITFLFFACSVSSTFSEFTLSYPTMMPDAVIEFITEQSYLLPFLQFLALLSASYLILIHREFVIKSSELPLIDSQQINNKLADEIEASNALNLDRILDLIKSKIDPSIPENKKIEKALFLLCHELQLSQGLVYRLTGDVLKLEADFAHFGDKSLIEEIEVGEGVTGQVAKNKNSIYLDEMPSGYLKIVSGLGEASPDFLAIISILFESNLVGVIEVSGMGKRTKDEIEILSTISTKIFSSLLAIK